MAHSFPTLNHFRDAVASMFGRSPVRKSAETRAPSRVSSRIYLHFKKRKLIEKKSNLFKVTELRGTKPRMAPEPVL